MSPEPIIRELLAPLHTDVEPSSRRFHVDREKIISHMVEVSLAPEARFSARARLGIALALAAAFALVGWGGTELFNDRARAAADRIEVVALRGQVKSAGGALAVGQPLIVAKDGSLETSSNAEARIKTGAGLEIDLLENTKVSLNELGLTQSSSALRLDRGRVRCVIPHDPSRTFSVLTADARIVDIGTIFSVTAELAGAGTTVHVEEGEVLVEHAGKQYRLLAPASWSSAPQSPGPTADATPPVAPTQDLAPATPRPRRDAVAKRPRATLNTETQLLQAGLADEQRGDFRGAARAFEQLVLRYPGSPLAPDARAALSRVKGRLESQK